MEAELQGMAAALAVSVRQAVDYQDLSALENLNQLLVDNRQPLLAAVYLDTGSGPELMAEFPEGQRFRHVAHAISIHQTA